MTSIVRMKDWKVTVRPHDGLEHGVWFHGAQFDDDLLHDVRLHDGVPPVVGGGRSNRSSFPLVDLYKLNLMNEWILKRFNLIS